MPGAEDFEPKIQQLPRGSAGDMRYVGEMKKHLLIPLSAFGLVAFTFSSMGGPSSAADGNTKEPSTAAYRLKIATVDMQELFKHYYRTNEAQKQINVERARIQKDNNERMAKIRDLAKQHRISVKAVESRLARLRKRLRQSMENQAPI